ncbi:MAG TPA: PmoA family protein, partial [Candidatus Paceibacterota bacterium]|nr:PmoA family protein [Candidatus Paceibacterota bacterium]
MHSLRASIRLAAFAFILPLEVPVLAADSPFGAEPTARPAEWRITYQGRPLMVYSCAPEKYKPYVKELCTVNGDNILRDAPHDHLHHHALMYGIRVNGLNFWEEAPGSGVQKSVSMTKPEIRAGAGGQPEAVLRQTIHWVEPADAFLPDTPRVALLVEQRTLTLTVDEARQEVALQWTSAFEVGAKTNQVVLTGSTYHGLGIRFLQDLDPMAAHLNAGSKPDLGDSRQDVSAHRWGSVAFDKPGKPATLVVYGDPANARGQANYFSMRTPFAYLSATQGLDKEPLVYRSGERFQIQYLVLLSSKL